MLRQGYDLRMQLRPMSLADLELLGEIDGTVESREYLHLGREGRGMASLWKLEQRPLREMLVEPNRLLEEARYAYKQVVKGIEEGIALSIEVEGRPAAALVALPRPEFGRSSLWTCAWTTTTGGRDLRRR